MEYEIWKKTNLEEMKQRFENYGWKRDSDLECFCKRIYNRIQANKK